MSEAPLRAVVVGAGYAAEGHVVALRAAGVEVSAIVARDVSVGGAVAARLGVARTFAEWSSAFAAVDPAIVTLATPAAVRLAPLEAAAARGCAILCDKPLATNVADAEQALRVVEAEGVVHAFAATRRYEPSVAWLAELVADGIVGPIVAVEVRLGACLAPPLPWSWALVRALGGGVVANHFPHVLAVLERILDSKVDVTEGEADHAFVDAPYLSGIHDYRDLVARLDALSPDEQAALPRRECDAETSYRAQLRFANGVSASVVSGPGAFGDAAIRIVGEHGELIGRGELEYEVRVESATSARALPVPDRLALPPQRVGGGTAARYGKLANEFVAAIRGEPHEPFLDLGDGVRYQRALEAIRSRRG